MCLDAKPTAWARIVAWYRLTWFDIGPLMFILFMTALLYSLVFGIMYLVCGELR